MLRVLNDARREQVWADGLNQLEAYLHLHDIDPAAWRQWLELWVWAWPPTLILKLPWGPMPHYGALGGLSGFQMDRVLDTLDRVLVKALGLSIRSAATDLAWRRIARLGVCERNCPECNMPGPSAQLHLYGAIPACVTCAGVRV